MNLAYIIFKETNPGCKWLKSKLHGIFSQRKHQTFNFQQNYRAIKHHPNEERKIMIEKS